MSPGPDRAVVLERQAVQVTTRDGHHSGKPRHLHRHEALRGRAIAKLAVCVVPPGPDRTIALERHTVVDAGDNGHRPTEPRHLHRHKARCGRAIAKLAKGIVSPSPDGAIALGRQAEAGGSDAGGGHTHYAAEPSHLHRHEALCGRAIAKLTG